jgi:hypothetical protein
MINFICGTTMCLQQYLGIGNTILNSTDQIIYASSRDTYACTVSGPIYKCQSITTTKDYTDPFRY